MRNLTRSSGEVDSRSTTRSLSLFPNHLDDLHRSGLSDRSIESWGCFSIDATMVPLLRTFGKGVSAPGLALPILSPGSFKATGFAYKPDKPRELVKNGKVRKCTYELPRHNLNRIHVPLAAQFVFRQPDGREGPIRLVITEGQKKSEKAAQEGIGCIAVLGVWSWFNRFGGESVPIEQLAAIDWVRYSVEICFDSDAAINPHVQRAELALARWLHTQGAAKVSIVRLPQADRGAKVGLDDYLVHHSVQEFENLPRLDSGELALTDAVDLLGPKTEKKERNTTLARVLLEETDPTERECLLKTAAKRTKVSLRSIRGTAEAEASRLRKEKAKHALSRPSTPDHLKAIKQQQQAAVEEILVKAQRTVTLRAQNWVNGKLIYIATFGGQAVLLNDHGEAAPATSLPEGLAITQPPPDRSPISPCGVRRFTAGEGIEASALFENLRDFFTRHAIFKHPSVAAALALWTMGTYVYTLFNYFGYLWFTSMGPSHGKSLVEKLLSMLSFNATSPTTFPTPATLFRDIEANTGTLILDEIENLDPEKKGDVLAILNAGFERGGVVPRSVPVGDGWGIRRFSVYCPKAIAGISYLPRTLHTRVFQIDMPKRKATESIRNFEPDRLAARAEQMCDDQAIFALRNASKIADMYAGRSELVPQWDGQARPLMDDRLRDILAPLYAVAAVIDHEAGYLVATPGLDQFAALQAGSREPDSTSEDYAVAARALFQWASPRWQSGKVVIKTAEAIKLFKSAEIDWVTDSAKVKSLLRKLGGINKATWWINETTRGYVFYEPDVQDLVDRYPIRNEAPGCLEQQR
jgi:hypothetical protein